MVKETSVSLLSLFLPFLFFSLGRPSHPRRRPEFLFSSVRPAENSIRTPPSFFSSSFPGHSRGVMKNYSPLGISMESGLILTFLPSNPFFFFFFLPFQLLGGRRKVVALFLAPHCPITVPSSLFFFFPAWIAYSQKLGVDKTPLLL